MDADHTPLTDDELLTAIRAALLGDVELVAFEPPPLDAAVEEAGDGVLLSAPAEPFRVLCTRTVERRHTKLNAATTRKVHHALTNALTLLSEEGPWHPKLRTHRYRHFDKHFGERVYQSYVSGGSTPWRVWWFFDTEDDHTITVAAIGPHPKDTTTPPPPM